MRGHIVLITSSSIDFQIQGVSYTKRPGHRPDLNSIEHGRVELRKRIRLCNPAIATLHELSNAVMENCSIVHRKLRHGIFFKVIMIILFLSNETKLKTKDKSFTIYNIISRINLTYLGNCRSMTRYLCIPVYFR